MKKIILTAFVLFLTSVSCETKKGALVEKSFRNDNTFVIVCRGYPKEGLSGPARVETAKEAALMNAQFLAQNIFSDTVNVFKNGNIEKYKIFENHVLVYYVIKKKGLKNYLNEK